MQEAMANFDAPACDVTGALQKAMAEGDSVCSHYSRVLPQILQVDPGAVFQWVWREFDYVRRSHISQADSWTATIYPTGGWPDHYDLTDKTYYYWMVTNLEIYKHLILLPRYRWHIQNAADLTQRQGGVEYDEPLTITHRGDWLNELLRGLTR